MSSTLPLIDVERRLGLFALAVAGHAYHIRPDEDFKSPVIAHRSGSPLSDADTLYLPSEVAAFATRTHNHGAYRLMALHQLGYREFGTFMLTVAEARRRVRALGVRPEPDAAPRESDLSLLLRHFAWPALARALFTVFEGARIDARMLAAYPGARSDWERCRALERASRPLPVSCSTAADFVEALIGWTLGHDRVAVAAADTTGALDAMIDAANPVFGSHADVYASVQATAHAYAIVESLGLIEPTTDGTGDIDPAADGMFPAPPSFHGEAPGDWQQREARLENWEDDLEALDRGFAAAMEHAESASKTTAGDVRSGQVVTNVSRADRDVLARRIEMERSSVRHALGRTERPTGPSFLYDEWDMHRQTYLRGWCRLYEVAVESSPDTDVAALLERVAPHRLAVQRRFAEIKPRGYLPVRRVMDGDELDIDELIDYYTETKRGNDVDERVYRRRVRQSRDVAVAFLLDLSASTDDPIVKTTPAPATDVDFRFVNLRDPFDDDDYLKSRLDEGPPPRRIIDVLRESLLLIAAALEHYRDQWGLYGFSGYGRDNVEYTVVKELGARFGYATLEALAALRPRRSTRMGPAIRHSAWKLARTASPLKVLIMVSDGFPQDCDYGPDRADHEYGVQDTAKALQEAERAGIETFCITVDRSGHDYLKRMCPQDRYLVIDELDALPLELTKVYQKLTAR